jgi:Helix-turn-helix domain
MTTRARDIIEKLPPDSRARVERRAKELIAEEMALRELRKAAELTQERMGELLGIGQDGVSRMEKRCDLLVSTLRGYVAAMGGRLRLVAELPDLPPVELVGLSLLRGAAQSEKPAKVGKRRHRRRAASTHRTDRKRPTRR